MDANKYKSVAIKVDVYNKAKPMAQADYKTYRTRKKETRITG
jgi:hypothetical protein